MLRGEQVTRGGLGKEMCRILIALTMLTVAACAETSGLVRVNSNYMQAWTNRLADYRQQFIAADTELRADADKLTGDVQAQKIRTWSELVPPVAGITDKVREAYTIAGQQRAARPAAFNLWPAA